MTVNVPATQPPAGNAIVNSGGLSWHQMLVSAFIVGISIWVIEQNVNSGYAWLLAIIILLGVAYAAKGFASELEAITQGKA